MKSEENTERKSYPLDHDPGEEPVKLHLRKMSVLRGQVLVFRFEFFKGLSFILRGTGIRIQV